ncbi:MAG: DUF262 domain-containing protein [Phocaeicola sp.]
MIEIKPINELDLYAIPDLCNKNYFIPDYQRGYRWGKIQIRQLLEDITEFFDNQNGTGKFYCLQPVVVKKLTDEQVAEFHLQSNFDNNTWYEVIDGQQRLTTIRIILALLTCLDEDNEAQFTIEYKTRPLLGKIFSSLQRDKDENGNIIAILPTTFEKLDIDSWHVLQAANQIISWFQKESTLRTFKGSFNENFNCDKKKIGRKSVQVIWYELRDGSNARDIFNRLNNNKIALTNSELIRAMFLSESSQYQIEGNYNNDDEKLMASRLQKQQKQAHIVEQWDIIEHKLRDEQFWRFLTNDSCEAYSNKIELLFNYVAERNVDSNKDSQRDELKKEDKLYTYLYFDRYINHHKNDLWDLWLIIEKYFATICYWYDDYTLYHKIGYLVHQKGTGIVPELLREAETKSKAFFLQESLNNRISETVNTDFEQLDYTRNIEDIKAILLLYNVTLSMESKSLGRFPFDLYKNTSWTLEHIHAQNSEGINSNDKVIWYKWIDENKKMLLNFKKNFTAHQEEQIVEIDNLIELLESTRSKERNKLTYNEIQIRFSEVLQFFDKLNADKNESEDMHKLSNMTLLSGTVNTSIGNMVFEGKRQSIIRIDSEGKDYIPYGTKRVFLKYHNKGDADFEIQQLYFWGKRDRDNYLKEILSTIKEYLNDDNMGLLQNLINKSNQTQIDSYE